MPNHVSAIKRVRQTKRKTAINRANKGVLRASLRALRTSLAKGQPEAAAMGETVSRIDKSVRKGLIHRNTAARLKSRLMKRSNAAPATAAPAKA
jgi:small subunit ribosomal protein S20